MIVFDLRCGAAHVFEAWFGSSGDFEAQRARGLISCPICGNGNVTKAAMAPAVLAKSSQRDGKRALAIGEASGSDTPVEASEPSPAYTKAMLKALAAAQAHVEATCDYVGERFAATARAIHDGEAPSRGIFGEATRAEAATLLADGIAVAPLPFHSRRNSDA